MLAVDTYMQSRVGYRLCVLTTESEDHQAASETSEKCFWQFFERFCRIMGWIDG